VENKRNYSVIVRVNYRTAYTCSHCVIAKCVDVPTHTMYIIIIRRTNEYNDDNNNNNNILRKPVCIYERAPEAAAKRVSCINIYQPIT